MVGLLNFLIERKQFQSIFDQWIENGRPLTAYLFYIFRYIDNPSTFSLILCNLGIAFTAYIIYRIVSFPNSQPKQAFFISVIGSIHPAYEISLAMPAVFYILSIPAFYMSGYIAIKSCLVSGFSKYIYIFFSAILMILSFAGEVAVFMTPLFLLIYFFHISKKNTGIFNLLLVTIQKLWWLIFLSLLYLLIIILFFDVSGDFEILGSVIFH